MFLYQKIKCNNEKLIEDNIYLFINWFHFNLLHMGYSHFFEIETHLSLAKKIKFQLTTNIDNSPNFIFSYLKNDLFSNSDLLFSKYDLCIDLLDVIRDIHNGRYTKGKHIRQTIEGSCFQSEIDDLINELESDYLNDLLNNFLRLLKEENLGTNKFDELKYFTNLIISHFLLKGYAHVDLQSSFHISNEDTSPFGIVTDHSIEINSIEEIADYFRSLDAAPTKEFTFYIPLEGVEYNGAEVLTYNDVKFFPVSNDEIRELLEKTQLDYGNWGVDVSESQIFCKTTIEAFTLRAAKEIAYNLFLTELAYFNSLNFNGRLHGEFFIGANEEGDFINFYKSHVPELSEYGINVFKNNPFEFFRGNSTEAKDRIKRFEPHFVNALSEPTNEREMSSLWHYLEVLFYRAMKEHGLKSFISTVLLLDENIYNLKEQVNADFFELLEKERNWELGIKDFETHEKLKNKDSINDGEIRSEVHNEFLKLLISVYDSFDVQKNLEKAQEYYYRIMDELYSVRNSFLHSGDVNELAISKLKYVAPFLVSRVRDILHSVIEREESFDDVANHLYHTGRALI